ncbi:MAG: FAD:protein FMN transferase [Muribaculaceae bacterium]|nr:FAD:protein FMN transferase [Muribaculaceae bacterium]
MSQLSFFHKYRRLPVFLFLIAPLCLGCQRKADYVKIEGIVWNTLYHITFRGPSSLRDSVMPVLNEVSHSLSVFEKNSLVSELNAADSLEVDGHFITVYDESLRINRLSHGLFDPTVGPLIEAWGFGPGHTPNADTLAVDSVMNFVGIQKTSRAGSLVIKEDARTRFNFSAIAKGYGCDAVAGMFERNGVSDFMIEIGGEITLSGKSPSGGDWKIAVDAPVEGAAPGEQTMMVLQLTDAGIATSGNYRNFRKEDGNTVAHTISPVTGRPFISKILSATVIAPSCMEADGIATACMAGTPAQARQLLENCKVEALLIFSDSIYFTPGFRKYVASSGSSSGEP